MNTMLSTIHSTDGRTTQSGCTSDDKAVLAIMTIGHFIGRRRSTNSKRIEIQTYHTNLIAAFFDSVGQGSGVGISGRIRRVLNVTAILVEISSAGDDEDTTHTEPSGAIT